MATCTFFGHRECPESIQPKLRQVLEALITCHGTDTFYVGNQGQFDAQVRRVLIALQQKYPHIHYAVVLAYMPGTRKELADYSDTMLPEGIELVCPRYAITWRNRWMLQQADCVVPYITHPWGGAAQFAEQARRMGKTTINIAEMEAV